MAFRRARITACWIACLVGCVSAEARLCDDGTVCPREKQCASVRGVSLCIDPDQLDACRDQPSAAPCGTERRCYDGVCVSSGCGDGFLDPDEMCDDGNRRDGDGCSGGCDSDETCGNGVIDLIVGEECDDGPGGARRSHDGCASDCTREVAGWQRVPSFRSSFILAGPSLAHDVARDRVVLWVYGDTWEWDGRRLIPRFPAIQPPARQHAALAYDAHRQRVVLFGGFGFADTWEWDGARWTLRTPSKRPSARGRHAMAYDARHRRVVLFGGVSSDTAGDTGVSETWTWDGTTWTKLAGLQPPAPEAATLVYDPVRGRLVLFGGCTGATVTDGTWELDDTTWIKRQPAVSPSPRCGHAAAFDVATGRVIVHGGGGGPTLLGDTWAWDGISWSLVSTTDHLWGRQLIASSPRRGELVMFAFQGTAHWNGAAWIEDTATDAALPVSKAATAVDLESGRIVVHGGRLSDNTFNASTWVWSGDWFQVTGPKPGAIAGAALAFDASRREFVLFGGQSSAGFQGQTWTFDGATWTQRTPPVSPLPRSDHVMVYDAARERIVLFGGTNGTSLRDTWLWDGVTWTSATSAMAPPARSGAAAAYDPVAEVVVLFGGQGPEYRDDTWLWDGATWTPQLVPGPSPRAGAGMAWDHARRRAVLYGGTSVFEFDDQWEWDGAGWSQLPVTPAFPARSYHTLVSSIDGVGVMSVAGQRMSAPLNDVAWLSWRGDVQPETCGADDRDGDGAGGCAATELDPDCWLVCHPACPLGPSGTTTCGGCGDGTCAPAREDCITCAADCGACVGVCGDFLCGGAETATTCPGDCP